ncbi:MAG: hypothetical protein RR140_03320 [Clostridia bacterium]
MLKKTRFIISLIGMMFILVGCVREPLSVSIINRGKSGAEHAVLINYSQEKLYKNKGVDLRLKSGTANVTFMVRKDLENFVSITLPEANEWHSLTTLLCNASEKPNTENFVKYDDAVNTTWLFKSEKDFCVQILCVAGDKFPNATKTGFLLTDTEPISKQFNLKYKK